MISGRLRWRDENGQAIVAVLALLVIVLLIGAAVLASGLSSNGDANRDTRARLSQQAADAGVEAQVYQQSEADLGSSSYNLNGGLLGTGISVDCIVPQLNASLQVTGLVSTFVSSTNSCPQAETSGGTATTYKVPLGNHSYDQSEFFPNEENPGGVSSERELFPEIVSLGSNNGTVPAGTGTVYSREKVLLAPVAPLQAIEGMGSVTLHGLTVLGTNLTATVNGDISTLGQLTLPLLTVGTDLLSSSIFPTFSASTFCTGSCPGTPISTAHYVTVSTTPCSAGSPSTSCVIQRSPVTISASKTDCETPAGVPETCSSTLFDCSTSCYNAATDTFSMSSGTAELPPGDYTFCNFSATGGTLEANPTSSAAVRIFIDSPTSSRCSGDGYTQNGSGVWNGGNFTALSGIDNLLEPTSPTGNTLAPSGVQIYVANTGANDTTVQIGPTTESTSLQSVYGLIVYAPASSVTVNVPAACVLTVCTGGVLDGSIVGDTVSISALTTTEDLDIGNYPLYSGVNAFHPVEYIQCSSAASLTGTEATDTSGC